MTDLLRQIAGVRVVPRGGLGYDIVMTRNALTSLSEMQRAQAARGFSPSTPASRRENRTDAATSDGKCEVAFYLDGGRFRPDPTIGINEILASGVTAVEIYRGPAETPVEFLGGSSRCGVIVIWTRRGPEG